MRSRLETIAHRPAFAAEAKRLSAVSNIRGAAALAFEWSVIGVCIVAAIQVGHWSAYLLAAPIIGARLHALGILMHDATHYRLFANRAWNDWICDIFLALPLGVILERYRHDHLRHHNDPNNEHDPYWVVMTANPRDYDWPKTRLRAALVFLRDLTGFGAIAFSREYAPWFPWANHFSTQDYPLRLTPTARLRIYLFYGTAATAVIYFGLWWELLVLWLLPFATFTQLFFRIRAIAEHVGLPDHAGADATRDIHPTWIERVLICPMNVSYHLTHHLFPGVPWYNLRKLSAVLHRDPEFRANAQISRTYLGKGGVLRAELLQPRAA
jgi:fatty acid desaturase